MFKTNQNKGFTMTFKNGITISVQFGAGNYCEQSKKHRGIEQMQMDSVESKTAEIAIWDKEGAWFSFGHDTVKGWVEADEVATWIILCTAATSLDDLKTRTISCGMIEEVEE
jgi:hypothetical protein